MVGQQLKRSSTAAGFHYTLSRGFDSGYSRKAAAAARDLRRFTASQALQYDDIPSRPRFVSVADYRRPSISLTERFDTWRFGSSFHFS